MKIKKTKGHGGHKNSPVMKPGGTSKTNSKPKNDPQPSAGVEHGNSLKQPEVLYPSTAFAFDIDGVLTRDNDPLPGARETLLMLQTLKVPFIFLTNTGGLTEAEHAAEVGQQLELQFAPEQFVLSHTPFRNIAPKLQDSNVLILGGVGQKSAEIAQAYGLKRILTSSDIFRVQPDIYPFAEITSAYHESIGRDIGSIPRTASGHIKIDAILVFSTPRDWGLDLELVVDLLLSHDGILGTSSPRNGDPAFPNNGYQQDGQPGVYFCNPELSSAGRTYPQPRLGQGSFTAALEGIWAAVTGGAELLNVFSCGKPTSVTFEYAERALLDYHSAQCAVNYPGVQQMPKLEAVYMVGDEPENDIAGANEFESRADLQWNSILVETGVYEARSVPSQLPTCIVGGVEDAVRLAFQRANKPFEWHVGLNNLMGVNPT